MKPYCDTSFLVSLYSLDAFSSQATAIAAAHPPPYPFSGLHSAEAITALHLRHTRGKITAAERDASLASVQADRESGLLSHVPLDWPRLWQAVEALASRHAQHFCRTLDLLHIAAALEWGADTLLSFDDRQRQAAQAEGMNVLPAALT